MDIVTLGAALHGAKSYTDATIAPLLGGVNYRGSVNYASIVAHTFVNPLALLTDTEYRPLASAA